MSTNLPEDAKHAPQLIPGGYDRTTLTHRQSGSMSGSAFGSTNVSTGPGSMNAATIVDREREGGGAPNQRRPNNADQRTVLGTSFFHYIRSFGVHVMRLRPVHDRIIVQRLDEESTQRIGTIVVIPTRSAVVADRRSTNAVDDSCIKVGRPQHREPTLSNS